VDAVNGQDGEAREGESGKGERDGEDEMEGSYVVGRG